MRMFTVLLLVFFASTAFANQKAITDTGDEVILFKDGTWSYADDTQTANASIPTNPQQFVKSDNATFMLKSTKNKTAFWVDTSLWSFKKGVSNEEAEYEFELKGEDLYGMAINEGLTMPLDTLANIALENARAVAPNARVLKKEYRTVNGVKVLYMEMAGNMDGIDFTYLGYYYSDEHGATQFITYTGSSLVEKYRSQVENFINGFTIQ